MGHKDPGISRSILDGLNGILNRQILPDEHRFRLQYPIALVVGDVVLLAEVAGGIDPGISTDHCAILEAFLLPKLSVVGLISEVPFGAFVRLDVVLVAVRRAPGCVDLFQVYQIKSKQQYEHVSHFCRQLIQASVNETATANKPPDRQMGEWV